MPDSRSTFRVRQLGWVIPSKCGASRLLGGNTKINRGTDGTRMTARELMLGRLIQITVKRMNAVSHTSPRDVNAGM